MIDKRIKLLLSEMEKENIDYYIVPTSDYHNSEYVSEFFKCREYMSGFSGSAGTLVVSKKEAILWTDGRYFIQAAQQLEGSGIELYKMGNPGVPRIREYLKNKCEELSKETGTDNDKTPGVTIGFDGRVMDISFVQELEKNLSGIGRLDISINPSVDLVGRIWNDRPELKAHEIAVFPERFAGKSASEKLNEIRLALKEKNIDYHLVASLDDIAWILNLRGGDVRCNPVFLSYLFISDENAVLFCHGDKLTKEAVSYLSDLGVEVKGYEDVYSFLGDYKNASSDSGKAKILLDPNSVNYRLFTEAGKSFEVVLNPNPSAKLKGIKNETEIENLRAANVIDGIAMVKFLKWLDDYKKNGSGENVTEIGAAEKLLEFRKMSSEFLDISFDTISAYGAHGAIVHYEPEPDTDIPVDRSGFLLVDSGAQYHKGTTDITRTIAMGELTESMKKHYTAVLKGNLRLAGAVFPEGASGSNLDILARGPLWDMMKDYNHGTGHGIGFYLNVHEGPQNINWKVGQRAGNTTPLAPGMVTSDEPGFYLEGEYGIRIENDILTVKKEENDYGTFLGFEVLTLAPIDLSPVIWEDMEKSEILALDSYHKQVYNKLSPYLDNETLKWLEEYIRH